jgi:hypothetical protein
VPTRICFVLWAIAAPMTVGVENIPAERMKMTVREPHGLESDLLSVRDLIDESAKPLRAFRARVAGSYDGK